MKRSSIRTSFGEGVDNHLLEASGTPESAWDTWWTVIHTANNIAAAADSFNADAQLFHTECAHLSTMHCSYPQIIGSYPQLWAKVILSS
jgi:hypothetical protein